MAITAAIHREALSEREEDAQRRLDFAAFAQQCFRELNPLTPLAMNWHVEVMTAKLAAVYRGEIRRLIINLPPEQPKSLKTLCLGGHGWKIGWKILFSHRSGPP